MSIVKELNKQFKPKEKTPEFDTSEWLVLRNKKFMEWFEDESAVQFAQIIGQSSELFDDMLDRDVVIDEHQIFNLIHSLWITLPFNHFWNAHKLFLSPILLMTINSWLVSNKLEEGSKNDRIYAYATRNLGLQIFPLMVYVLHGDSRMREVSVDIHKFFTDHETFEQYENKAEPYKEQGAAS